jgi:hypothetical protein
MSNLGGGTVTPQSPQRPGYACQVNGSRDGFPPGDQFEGAGHSAEDKPERENPDVYSAVRPGALQIAQTL